MPHIYTSLISSYFATQRDQTCQQLTAEMCTVAKCQNAVGKYKVKWQLIHVAKCKIAKPENTNCGTAVVRNTMNKTERKQK